MLKRVLIFVLLLFSQAFAQPSPDSGLPRRADLGITLHFTQKPIVGAEVRSVTQGGFGEQIGVRKGDIVTSIEFSIPATSDDNRRRLAAIARRLQELPPPRALAADG